MLEVEELLEHIDIVEYIGQFVDLEEKDGEWWGLSPFTAEQTPSFSVDGEQQLYYDFSSGHGGNVLTFIQRHFKVNFRRAIEIAEAYAGIDSTAVLTPKPATIIALKKFAKKKEKNVQPHGALSDNVMDRYEFNKDKLQLWVDDGIPLATLKRYGVRYDAFSDRIVYPVKNSAGKIVSISGRTADPQWHEKHLKKYTYFQPLGQCDLIYNLSDAIDEIKRKKEIILFEGAKSVMLADTFGFKNTGALLTSHLNPYQTKILIGLGVRVVFALDAGILIDEDAQVKRMRHFLPIEYIWNYNKLLEQKESPVDRGQEVFKILYENRRRLN